MSEEQMKWLMSTIGLGEVPVKRFSVEYLVSGGGYSSTIINASTLSELIDMTIEHNTHNQEIAIIVLDRLEKGVKKQFHLLNYTRI